MHLRGWFPALCLIGLAGLSVSAPASGQISARDRAALVEQAYIYGYPAFELARLIYRFTADPQNAVNRFGHRRTLADHTARTVTTPNNDTLYSSAILDLSEGPVRLDVPDFADRYYSVAFVDAYTNNFAHIGTRSGTKGATSYLIAGPNWKGETPDNIAAIRSPSDHIVAIARIRIEGETDYPAVHALQDRLVLTPPRPISAQADVLRPIPESAGNFVAVVNRVLRDSPPPAADAPLLAEIEKIGIGAHAAPLTAELRSLWEAQYPVLRARLVEDSKTPGGVIDGWSYTPLSIGNFGTDYRTRAIIAVKGILADIPAEIAYTAAVTDRDGKPLDGDRRYRLHLPAGMPPAEGFWSFAIYEVTKEGSLFFGDNPLHRYAIKSNTEGLMRNADGSLDLLLQKQRPPGGEAEANWLPIPSKSFMLVARVYMPGPTVLGGTYRYPGLELLDEP